MAHAHGMVRQVGQHRTVRIGQVDIRRPRIGSAGHGDPGAPRRPAVEIDREVGHSLPLGAVCVDQVECAPIVPAERCEGDLSPVRRPRAHIEPGVVEPAHRGRQVHVHGRLDELADVRAIGVHHIQRPATKPPLMNATCEPSGDPAWECSSVRSESARSDVPSGFTR